MPIVADNGPGPLTIGDIVILSTNENAEMGHTRVFSLTFKNRLGALGFTGGECGSAAPLTVGHGHNSL